MFLGLFVLIYLLFLLNFVLLLVFKCLVFLLQLSLIFIYGSFLIKGDLISVQFFSILFISFALV